MPEPWEWKHGRDYAGQKVHAGVGTETKDRIEIGYTDGRKTLAEAQRAIAEDWFQTWVEAGRP